MHIIGHLLCCHFGGISLCTVELSFTICLLAAVVVSELLHANQAANVEPSVETSSQYHVENLEKDQCPFCSVLLYSEVLFTSPLYYQGYF